MDFEWDEGKAASNLEKHGVSFEVVLELDWSSAITRPDDRIDYGEKRWRALHLTEDGRRYVVVFSVRRGNYRIISVRRSHEKESRKWEV